MAKLRVAIALLAVLVLAASDWPTNLVSGFWVAHPLTAALVGGALVVAITALILDAYLQHRRAQRWHRIRHVAAAEISELLLTAFVGLNSCLGLGSEPTANTSSYAGVDCAYAIARSGYADELDALAPNDHAGRLAVLIGDVDWAQYTYWACSRMEALWAQCASRWMPTLMSTLDRTTAEPVDRTAACYHRVGILPTDILEVVLDGAPFERLVRHWTETFAAIVTEQDYWVAEGVQEDRDTNDDFVSGGWQFVKPELVPQEVRLRIERSADGSGPSNPAFAEPST